MNKAEAFDLIEEAIRQGGFLRYRRDYHPLKWRFCHPRHRAVVCWGKTPLEAVREFAKFEKRWARSRGRKR